VTPSAFELGGDFELDVIAASQSTPVVVDFWAEWCGPCRALGPVLESLAQEADGRWRLVKVDTERHPDLAQRFGIRGIPAVMLFHDGRVTAEFTGALPEPQVRRWLQQNLPRPSDAAFAEALARFECGDRDGARDGFEDVVRADPEHHAARLQLARLLLETDPGQAQRTASAVPDAAPEFAAAQSVVLLARLARWSGGEDVDIQNTADASADDLALYRDGASALRDGDPGGALEKWITLLSQNRTLDDDGARRACVALFSLLGEDSEITRTWRRRFSTALH
jgi:putative thioredoxin